MTAVPTDPPAPTAGGASRLRCCLRCGLKAGLALVVLGATLWAAAALYFDVRVSWLQTPLALAYLAVVLAFWIFVKPRRRALALTSVGFAVVLGWWLLLKPSNQRDWQRDVAVLPYADFDGNRVTIHNIRNCDYRTETDFDVHYYDKVFDLDRLQSSDLYMVYWGSPLMAHTMISFGFQGGDYVCFSIETRKKQGDTYSAVRGLFRQFELTYVIADERDVVRLRTNYRHGEEVYLYRLRGSPEQARQLFLDYLHRANRLRQQPEWYARSRTIAPQASACSGRPRSARRGTGAVGQRAGRPTAVLRARRGVHQHPAGGTQGTRPRQRPRPGRGPSP